MIAVLRSIVKMNGNNEISVLVRRQWGSDLFLWMLHDVPVTGIALLFLPGCMELPIEQKWFMWMKGSPVSFSEHILTCIFVLSHLKTLSLGLPFRCSVPGWQRSCLSWLFDSFSAAAMGHPERLDGWKGGKKILRGVQIFYSAHMDMLCDVAYTPRVKRNVQQKAFSCAEILH